MAVIPEIQKSFDGTTEIIKVIDEIACQSEPVVVRGRVFSRPQTRPLCFLPGGALYVREERWRG